MQAVWQAEKSYEFMWRGSKSLPIPQSEILTHIINGNYGGAVLLTPTESLGAAAAHCQSLAVCRFDG